MWVLAVKCICESLERERQEAMQGKRFFAEGHATTFKDVSYDLQLKMIFLNDTANLAFEPIGVVPARVLDKAWMDVRHVRRDRW